MSKPLDGDWESDLGAAGVTLGVVAGTNWVITTEGGKAIMNKTIKK